MSAKRSYPFQPGGAGDVEKVEIEVLPGVVLFYFVAQARGLRVVERLTPERARFWARVFERESRANGERLAEGLRQAADEAEGVKP